MGALSPESLVSRSHGAWIAVVNVRLFPVRIALVAAALTVLCCICLRLLSEIIMVKARIVNTSSPSIFSARKLPGFIEQSQGSEALGRFRRHLDQVLVWSIRIPWPKLWLSGVGSGDSSRRITVYGSRLR